MRITGISQDVVDHDGERLETVLKEFVAFRRSPNGEFQCRPRYSISSECSQTAQNRSPQSSFMRPKDGETGMAWKKKLRPVRSRQRRTSIRRRDASCDLRLQANDFRLHCCHLETGFKRDKVIITGNEATRDPRARDCLGAGIVCDGSRRTPRYGEPRKNLDMIFRRRRGPVMPGSEPALRTQVAATTKAWSRCLTATRGAKRADPSSKQFCAQFEERTGEPVSSILSTNVQRWKCTYRFNPGRGHTLLPPLPTGCCAIWRQIKCG